MAEPCPRSLLLGRGRAPQAGMAPKRARITTGQANKVKAALGTLTAQDGIESVIKRLEARPELVGKILTMLDQGYFDESPQGQGDGPVLLPRSYRKMSQLSVRILNSMLGGMEPMNLNAVILGQIDSTTKAELCYFALDGSPGQKLPSVQTEDELVAAYMTQYARLGKRLANFQLTDWGLVDWSTDVGYYILDLDNRVVKSRFSGSQVAVPQADYDDGCWHLKDNWSEKGATLTNGIGVSFLISPLFQRQFPALPAPPRAVPLQDGSAGPSTPAARPKQGGSKPSGDKVPKPNPALQLCPDGVYRLASASRLARPGSATLAPAKPCAASPDAKATTVPKDMACGGRAPSKKEPHAPTGQAPKANADRGVAPKASPKQPAAHSELAARSRQVSQALEAAANTVASKKRDLEQPPEDQRANKARTCTVAGANRRDQENAIAGTNGEELADAEMCPGEVAQEQHVAKVDGQEEGAGSEEAGATDEGEMRGQAGSEEEHEADEGKEEDEALEEEVARTEGEEEAGEEEGKEEDEALESEVASKDGDEQDRDEEGKEEGAEPRQAGEEEGQEEGDQGDDVE